MNNPSIIAILAEFEYPAVSISHPSHAPHGSHLRIRQRYPTEETPPGIEEAFQTSDLAASPKTPRRTPPQRALWTAGTPSQARIPAARVPLRTDLAARHPAVRAFAQAPAAAPLGDRPASGQPHVRLDHRRRRRP